MSSCSSTTSADESPVQIRYLAIGDSYTIGESVGGEDTFPAQLISDLTAGHNLTIESQIIAKTGWTTAQLITAIDDARPEGTFQLVTLLIGVNNQYRGLDKTQYRLEFRDLLQKAINYTGNEAFRVIVLSIPDYGVTPFAKNMNPIKIAEEINAFNAINFEETGKTDANYIEITELSRLAATDKSLLAGDSLHPSKEMYRQWVNKIFPVALSSLHIK